MAFDDVAVVAFVCGCSVPSSCTTGGYGILPSMVTRARHLDCRVYYGNSLDIADLTRSPELASCSVRAITLAIL